ncbi:MAG: acetylxylan esterase [Kiritimatiellae bacterium]|nr:acetylxylan esterase [Kiritimatiellia bacterium]
MKTVLSSALGNSRRSFFIVVGVCFFFSGSYLCSLAGGEPTALYASLVERAQEVSGNSLFELPSLETWEEQLPEKRRKWLEMLGLDPLPLRTDLNVTITGTLDRGSYVVEKLHFQPIPGCRIAANLYRPKEVKSKLPAVVYLCGHAKRGKFHYQLHPRWFAEHGYVAMILDTIAIGESSGFHHGTYSKGWWHWISQGYSPAGVEVWAAMRAADYLQTRPEVNAKLLGITGNSGGGTISWFTGAADPRFKVVVPSCQTGNMVQHVRDRTLDGHCDCSYWVNTYGWDFTDLAGLIAPRALLVAAATEDTLFRPYAFRDLVHRARQLYILNQCEDKIGLVEAVTQHGYSPKTRLAIFNWFEKNLKGADKPVTDDLAENPENDAELAVYKDMKAPEDDKMKEVDAFFIPLPALPELKDRRSWEEHRDASLIKLRELTFRQIPETINHPGASVRRQGQDSRHQFRTYEFHSEPGMLIRAQLATPISGPRPYPLVVGAMQPDARTSFCAKGAGNSAVSAQVAGYACVEVRGTGSGSVGPGIEWTARRAYPIVGQSYYERKTLDLLTAIQLLRRETNVGGIIVFGQGTEAAVAIYAALLDPEITEVVLQDPVITHWEGGPEFLNVLKIGDLPHNLALMFPRPVSFVGKMPKEYEWTRRCYDTCGEGGRVRVIPRQDQWSPYSSRSAADAGP